MILSYIAQCELDYANALTEKTIEIELFALFYYLYTLFIMTNLLNQSHLNLYELRLI